MRAFLIFVGVAAIAFGLASAQTPTPAPTPSTSSTPARPNIIVILADDLGFSDLSCYGSEIPTPNLDALAADGLKFTNFHNMSRCCPSRATLLTGLYSHQAGVGHMTGDTRKKPAKIPSYQEYLNTQCVTEAEVLNPAGYFTCMTGKMACRPGTRRDAFQSRVSAVAEQHHGRLLLVRQQRGQALPQWPGHQDRRGCHSAALVFDRLVDQLRAEVHRYGADGAEAVLPLPRLQLAALPPRGAAGGNCQVSPRHL